MTATMARPAQRRDYGHTDKHGRAWPVEQLVVVTGQPLPVLAELVGYSRRNGHRWAHWGTFSDAWADKIACALGLHPWEVWPDWGDGVIDEEAIAC